MKLITFKYNSKEQVGILSKNEDQVYPLEALGINYNSMNDLIENITDQEMTVLKTEIEKDNNKDGISVNNIEKMAPIPVPKQDIICLGINYIEHAKESARYKKEAFEKDREDAIYFSKRVNAAIGDGAYIPSYPELVDSLDYEAELAVIISKDAKNISENDAFNYVFGYTIINDVSARNVQTKHKQWYFGKSLDGFTPMGPSIVTKDEFDTPPVLKICSRVNGELRQNSTTDLMITSIEEVIHELSQGMTLKAGTIISMGTPAGVGMGFTPPKFLKPGDVVECEVEGIGCLKNTIE
ncbi:Ureidoglycolate lyase [Clostridium sp. DL-VIII]|uniref:fumarylacetoacetate hydrolase family protein n=1 Tax=Clostridium sp. DL-VIII TaxID=641107 RepID=UPI00023B0434|nr:fumarylacetoacetate hydrolase family protein [Clostridium sp. DL-VIII]EHJ02415.1 Ureidoglycolate lyase [Clostridium sp. DL-VIII]